MCYLRAMKVDQPVLVDLIYNKSLEGGFFIEAGAWDGEYSNHLKANPTSPQQVKPSATHCSLSWTMGEYLNDKEGC